MKSWLKLVLLSCLLASCAIPTGANAAVGMTAVGSVVDYPGGGYAGEGQDWKYNVGATAQAVNRLNVYLGSGSIGKPEIGIYNDASPHVKLASCTIAAPVSGTWNSCPIPSQNLAANTAVWLAALQPTGQPNVEIRREDTGLASYRLGKGGKAALPATWSNGTHYGVQSASLYADTAPPPADTTAPTASFGVPTAGQTVSGTLHVTANAQDNAGGSGVWFVAFRVDSPNQDPDQANSYSSPYGFALDTRTLADGPHTMYARPVDNAQNVGADASVTFTVNNTNPPQCSDGLDNDADGLIDYPADRGCSSSTDNDETDPSGAPPSAIAGQGYHEVFRDDFNTLNRSVWDDHIWYDGSPNPSWTGFQEVDPEGILHLRTGRNMIGSTGQPYPTNTITTQTSGKTFQYGYFEARMKWSAGHGSWPAFWLYSYKHATDASQCTTQAGEVDVMEGQGSEPNVFYGTVHSNTNGCSPSDQQNGNNWQSQSTDLTQGFHTYAVKWAPGTVTWYLDGVQTHTASTYATDDQPMYVLLQEWTGGWTFGADATSPDVMENQIDYVDIWQQ
jgi:hypothetical protein